MNNLKQFSLVFMSLFYIAAGVNHFLNAEIYLKIMPDYLPFHSLLNQISGLAEVLLGVLILIPSMRNVALWGIIALLIAIYPANIYLVQHPDIFPEIPHWILWARLPFQFLFIAWAYWHIDRAAKISW